MPTFFEVDSSMFKDLAGFYDVVQCTKFRQSNPDGATTFKGNDISWGLLPSVEGAARSWLNDATSGSLAVQKQAPSASYSEITHLLSLKLVASGPDWECTNCSDMMFGKTILCLSGDTFVAGIPLMFFKKSGKSIVDCSTALGQMSRNELHENGGFFSFLKSHQAITIPPGYLIFQCNHGCMGWNENTVNMNMKGSDFLVSCLYWGCVSHHASGYKLVHTFGSQRNPKMMAGNL